MMNHNGNEESLISTRKRRSNAGSRLKQLLQAEELSNYTEEDENLELLFQEDEDDGEFKLGEKDKYYGSDSENDQSESEVNGGDNNSIQEKEDESCDSDKSVELNEDNDEMFSDSSDDSDLDESDAGEREIQKIERQKKRLQQKKAKQIPKIKQRLPSEKSTKKPKKIYGVPIKAETLLSLNRRQSSRAAVVQNKMNLVSKLKDEEKRRSKLKPIQKVEYIELTQEERLEEALETEKYNVSTLNKYQEQELDKQKKRKALQASKRKKLENIVSFKTCEKYVTVIEEHELEKFLLTRDKLKKKDRRGRKSDKQKREEEEARRLELEKQKKLEQLMNPEKRFHDFLNDEEGPEIKKQKLEEIVHVKNEVENSDLIDAVPAESQNIIENPLISETEENKDTSSNTFTDGHKESVEGTNEELSESVPNEDPNYVKQTIKIEADEEPKEETTPEVEIKETEDIEMVDAKEIKLDDLEISKQVKFEDSISLTRETSVVLENTIEPETIIYEGPEEKVGVNIISFERNLKINEIKAFLFGEDSLLGVTRRFRDVEPLVRIKSAETSTSNTIKIEQPNLEVLDNFPIFGDYNKVKKEKVILETRQDITVVLRTGPPNGIYLANGSKKQCLITGKPAMYFDPKTGMPYHDVESYKIIQRIQDSEFNWCEFPGGGAYVFDRELTKHAKGVPDNFEE